VSTEEFEQNQRIALAAHMSEEHRLPLYMLDSLSSHGMASMHQQLHDEPGLDTTHDRYALTFSAEGLGAVSMPEIVSDTASQVLTYYTVEWFDEVNKLWQPRSSARFVSEEELRNTVKQLGLKPEHTRLIKVIEARHVLDNSEQQQ